MAFSAHNDEDMMIERSEKPDELEQKIDRLTELIKKSKHVIFFTGAGISTSAGISDFRGPDGIWTRAAKGLKRDMPKLPAYSVVPTLAHMVIVALFNQKLAKFLISQNCDGLHRKSGVRHDQIAELHGNCGIEICEKCGKEHHRDFPAIRLGVVDNVNCPKDHFTGRYCTSCNGRLLESTVDFNQSLPVKPLMLAEEHGKKSDLCIVLGSSCTVAPACKIPERVVKRNGGSLVIVNLQKTPLFKTATMNIFAKIDEVMKGVADRLSLTLPIWKKKRRLRIDNSFDNNKFWKLSVIGLQQSDQHEENNFWFTSIRRITVQVGGRTYISPMPSPNKEDFTEMPFELIIPSEALTNVHWATVVIGWYGWHDEPPVMIPMVIRHNVQNMVLDYTYDVNGTKTWDVGFTPKFGELMQKFEVVRNRMGSVIPNDQITKIKTEILKKFNGSGIEKKIKEFNLVEDEDLETYNQLIQLARGGENNIKYTRKMNDFLSRTVKRSENVEKLYPIIDILRVLLIVNNGSSFMQFCMLEEENVIKEWITDLLELYEESASHKTHGNQLMIIRFFNSLFGNELFAQKAGLNQIKVVLSNLKYNEEKHKDNIAYNEAFSNLLNNYAVYLKKWHFSRIERNYLVGEIDRFLAVSKEEERILKKMKEVKEELI